MTPKFSLQRVLELKERREQATAMRLAEARAAADAARQAERELEELRKDGDAGRPGAAGTTSNVGQLQNARYVLERLDASLAEARSAVRKADEKVNACIAEFSVAARERQALDRLKERKHEAALALEASADQKRMDDIAISRFLRAGNTAEGSGS